MTSQSFSFFFFSLLLPLFLAFRGFFSTVEPVVNFSPNSKSRLPMKSYFSSLFHTKVYSYEVEYRASRKECSSVRVYKHTHAHKPERQTKLKRIVQVCTYMHRSLGDINIVEMLRYVCLTRSLASLEKDIRALGLSLDFFHFLSLFLPLSLTHTVKPKAIMHCLHAVWEMCLGLCVYQH